MTRDTRNVRSKMFGYLLTRKQNSKSNKRYFVVSKRTVQALTSNIASISWRSRSARWCGPLELATTTCRCSCVNNWRSKNMYSFDEARRGREVESCPAQMLLCPPEGAMPTQTLSPDCNAFIKAGSTFESSLQTSAPLSVKCGIIIPCSRLL